MAIPAYSTRFADIAGFSGGPTNVYAVLPNELVVVKCVAITVGVNAAPGSVMLKMPSGAIAVENSGNPAFPAAPYNLVVYGAFTYLAGESIVLDTSGGWSGDVTLSGYVLNATAP